MRCKLVHGEKAPPGDMDRRIVHAALDWAVFAAYGWPEGIGEKGILKSLLALNMEKGA